MKSYQEIENSGLENDDEHYQATILQESAKVDAADINDQQPEEDRADQQCCPEEVLEESSIKEIDASMKTSEAIETYVLKYGETME